MLRTSGKQNWRTPRWFFKWLESRGVERFVIDVAATPANAMCKGFYTEADDALTKPWPSRWFCNPPFARIEPWLRHAIAQGTEGTMIIPAASIAAQWFVDIWEQEPPFRATILSPRVAFIGPGASPNGAVAILEFSRQCEQSIRLERIPKEFIQKC